MKIPQFAPVPNALFEQLHQEISDALDKVFTKPPDLVTIKDILLVISQGGVLINSNYTQSEPEATTMSMLILGMVATHPAMEQWILYHDDEWRRLLQSLGDLGEHLLATNSLLDSVGIDLSPE